MSDEFENTDAVAESLPVQIQQQKYIELLDQYQQTKELYDGFRTQHDTELAFEKNKSELLTVKLENAENTIGVLRQSLASMIEIINTAYAEAKEAHLL